MEDMSSGIVESLEKYLETKAEKLEALFANSNPQEGLTTNQVTSSQPSGQTSGQPPATAVIFYDCSGRPDLSVVPLLAGLRRLAQNKCNIVVVLLDTQAWYSMEADTAQLVANMSEEVYMLAVDTRISKLTLTIFQGSPAARNQLSYERKVPQNKRALEGN